MTSQDGSQSNGSKVSVSTKLLTSLLSTIYGNNMVTIGELLAVKNYLERSVHRNLRLAPTDNVQLRKLLIECSQTTAILDDAIQSLHQSNATITELELAVSIAQGSAKFMNFCEKGSISSKSESSPEGSRSPE